VVGWFCSAKRIERHERSIPGVLQQLFFFPYPIFLVVDNLQAINKDMTQKKTKSTATVSTRLTLEERAELETISANIGKSPCEMVRMFVLAGMGLPTNNIPTRNRWKPTAEISKVAA
jgi:hypothetical protein